MSIESRLQLIQRLRNKEIILADGSLLELREDIAGGTGEFNLDNSTEIEKFHLRYKDEAHSEISISNTVHSSRFALQKQFSGKELDVVIQKINQKGVEYAFKTGNFLLGAVTADYGGAVIPPGLEGLLPEEYASLPDVQKNYQEQIRYLLETDCIAAIYLMTFRDLHEAQAAIDATRAVSPDTPIILSFQLGMYVGVYNKNPIFLMNTEFGITIEKIVSQFANKVQVIGVNCVLPEYAADMVSKFRESLSEYGCGDMPLIAQPNANIPRIGENGRAEYLGSQEFAKYMLNVVQENDGRGGMIVGGCCGTTPKHIKATHDILQRHSYIS